MAKVSVIVPVYRVEKYLARCVDSVLTQTASDLELILVDDGSPDGCPAICDRYAQKDRRVHVIHQKNGGLSAARNAGIDWVMEHSDSRWITFLDSDDWLHRDYLKRLLGAESSGAGLIACGYHRVSQYEQVPIDEPPVYRYLDPESAYLDYYLEFMTACCKLIRRDLVGELRFPVGKLHEDCFITHLWLLRTEKAAVLDEKLYYYYYNPDSITRSRWTARRLDELQAHEARLEDLKNSGLQKAEIAERQALANATYRQIETLAVQGGSEKKEYLGGLRKRLRSLLKDEKDLAPLNAETVWMYLMAWHTAPLWYLGKKLQRSYHRMKGEK